MIRFQNLSLSFAHQELFQNINFSLNKGEKIGLIGRNGSGKSTLLKLLIKELEPSAGNIITSKDYSIGYLQQHLNFSYDVVLEEVCSVLPSDRIYEEWKAEKILMGLGFSIEQMLESPKTLSGGWQIRIQFAKLLLQEPDLLLLDEPTNYLDIYSIRWIKNYLRKWSQELILITHDRNFMDHIINTVAYIHRENIVKIKGTTSKLYTLIQTQEEQKEKEYRIQEKHIKKTQEWIDKNKTRATTAKRAQSRMKMLEKLSLTEKLSPLKTLQFQFHEAPYISRLPMINVQNITFGYTKDILIQNLTTTIHHKDRICIIGKNGKGKSTLLKLFASILQPIQGEVIVHSKVKLGYFGQMNTNPLHNKMTVLEELQTSNPSATEKEIRKVLNVMMFSQDQVHKKICVLSGGEKSRINLAKIILTPKNILLLDEPTNHLDMESSESLLNALQQFKGPLIIVTHNEYFLNTLATKLIVFDEHKVDNYNMGYNDFLKNIGWKET